MTTKKFCHKPPMPARTARHTTKQTLAHALRRDPWESALHIHQSGGVKVKTLPLTLAKSTM